MFNQPITIILIIDTEKYLKVDESSRQREEINVLLSQVCDLQKRVQTYSHENDDLTANLRVYQVVFYISIKYCKCVGIHMSSQLAVLYYSTITLAIYQLDSLSLSYLLNTISLIPYCHTV